MTDEQLKQLLEALESGEKEAFSAIYSQMKTPVIPFWYGSPVTARCRKIFCRRSFSKYTSSRRR